MVKTITHYTTLEGFKGIIENKCLWASDSAFLNDKKEITLTLDILKEEINKNKDKFESKTLSILRKALNICINRHMACRSYLVCFCKDDDNLSLWRGYTINQQGIGLTFDTEKANEFFLLNQRWAAAVEYIDIQDQEKRNEIILKLIEDVEEEEFSETNIEKLYSYEVLIRIICALYKDIGFQDEKEYRFIVREWGKYKKNYRVRGNRIVPYIKIPDVYLEASNLPPLTIEDKVPLLKIRIGPGHDQELTARSIATFLAANDYSSIITGVDEISYKVNSIDPIVIEYSNIPFRLEVN